jgi:hypothetical protein
MNRQVSGVGTGASWIVAKVDTDTIQQLVHEERQADRRSADQAAQTRRG